MDADIIFCFDYINRTTLKNAKTNTCFLFTTTLELRAQPLYNGQPPYGLRGFIGDLQNRIMGYGMLRQIRVKKNTCKVHPAVFDMTHECADASALINEDHADYCDGWEDKNALTENLPSCQSGEFRYTTDTQLNSLPYNALVTNVFIINTIYIFLEQNTKGVE